MSHQELSKRNKQLIKQLFREHYKGIELNLPSNFIMREFAFQTFDSETYIRHKAFRSTDELRDYMVKIVPKHAYFSSAIYEDPAAEDMDSKVWLGADLIFDIDADHVPGCEGSSINVCLGRCLDYDELGMCRECEGDYVGITHITIECLEKAKEHLINLIDVLVNDFGFSKDRVKVYFSGHRGFHVHVECKGKWLKLDSSERREIVDYIKGVGIDVYILNLSIRRKGKGRKKTVIEVPPRIIDGGWRRRVAKEILNLGIIEGELVDFIRGVKPLTRKPEYPPLDYSELIHGLGIAIDEKVTIDIKRLIRLPNSINGKAGFKVVNIDIDKLSDFILDHALSPFHNYLMKVYIPFSFPQIRVIDIDIKGVEGEKLVLPGSVAMYLALKGLAFILDIS